MRTIWKFPLTEKECDIEMPMGSNVLTVQVQGDKMCVWANVDPDTDEKETRRFACVGTGRPIPSMALDYIGTVQLDNAGIGDEAMVQTPTIVWHIFEVL